MGIEARVFCDSELRVHGMIKLDHDVSPEILETNTIHMAQSVQEQFGRLGVKGEVVVKDTELPFNDWSEATEQAINIPFWLDDRQTETFAV